MLVDIQEIYKTNGFYWDLVGNDFLEPIALPLYGAFISEENCRLFGDVEGKRLLEIGCGTGLSLLYLGARKASELWGIDLSKKQLQQAERLLSAHGLSAKLICSPMEEECGLPKEYFDFAYSIYAIGWTADLDETFHRIASYLKKDGVFIFSWSHPIHKCVLAENGRFVFGKSYFDESLYSVSIGEGVAFLSDRKLSSYVNALVKAGFSIEQMIEQPEEELLQLGDGDFAKWARTLPVTFVIKARKQ